MQNNLSEEFFHEEFKAHADLDGFLSSPDKILKERCLVWLLKDGDCNTKKFHACLNKRKMQISIDS